MTVWMKEVKKYSNGENVTAKSGDGNTGAEVRKQNYDKHAKQSLQC